MNEQFFAIREIYEKKSVSQRNLAKALDISVGKANQIVSKLKDDGYLKSDGYTLTDKSIDLLKKNKVEAAVILASDVEIRDKSNTHIPVALVNIEKDTTLIERIISCLKEKNINDIYIVVHDMIERYEYLIDQYNINLIYDENERRNNLSKLLKVKNICENKNTYIIDSDVYTEKNPLHEYEIETYVNGVYLQDLGIKYRMIINKSKELISCEKGGVNAYASTHIAYFMKDFSKLFFSLLTKYDIMPSAKDLTYPDVIIRNLDVLPPIYVYPLQVGKYVDVYSIRDIDEARDKDIGSSKFPMEKVAKIFDIKENKITNIEKVSMQDKTFTFSIKDKKHQDKIYKLKHLERRLIKERDIEESKKFYDKLYQYNDFEKVVHEGKDNIIISELYDGERLCDIENNDDRKVILRALKKMHNIKIDDELKAYERDFKAEEMIDNMKNMVNNYRLNDAYKDLMDSIDKIRKVVAYLRGFKRVRSICKIRIDKDDFSYTKSGVKIKNIHTIYVSDPFIDIASLGVLYNYDSDNILKLYDEYNNIIDIDNIASKNMQPKDAKNIVIALASIIYLFKSIEILIKEYTINEKMGDTGFRYYRLFKTCIKRLNSEMII